MSPEKRRDALRAVTVDEEDATLLDHVSERESRALVAGALAGWSGVGEGDLLEDNVAGAWIGRCGES